MTEELAKFLINEIIDKVNHDYSSCYFYSELQDMNAKIPSCDYYDNYGYCPCLEGKSCDKYINRKEVHRMVKEYVDAKG